MPLCPAALASTPTTKDDAGGGMWGLVGSFENERTRTSTLPFRIPALCSPTSEPHFDPSIRSERVSMLEKFGAEESEKEKDNERRKP